MWRWKCLPIPIEVQNARTISWERRLPCLRGEVFELPAWVIVSSRQVSRKGGLYLFYLLFALARRHVGDLSSDRGFAPQGGDQTRPRALAHDLAAMPTGARSGRLCCKKYEENAEEVKSQFPVQLRQPLQTGWR